MNVGVLLAAGASSRMGRPKPLVRHRGQSFLVRGVRALWSACDTVIVVLGSGATKVRREAEQEFQAALEAGALAPEVNASEDRELEVHFVENRAWKSGMLSSARVGIAAASRLKPSAVLVLPVDHPEVKGATVAQLAHVMHEALGAFGKGTKPGLAYALVPRHHGMRGHPLALSPVLAGAVAHDTRARDLGDAVRRHARMVAFLDVSDRGIAINRNTPKR